VPTAAGKRWFTAVMPRDHPATAVAACAACATSWRGLGRAHCRACHVTFDDEVLFDAHRLTGRCVPPRNLDSLLWALCGAGCWPGNRPGPARSALGAGVQCHKCPLPAPKRSPAQRRGRSASGAWVRGRSGSLVWMAMVGQDNPLPVED
jgi:hypothetical protein